MPDGSDKPFEIRLIVAGTPQGKGRARAFRRGSIIAHYTPEETRTYEGIIRFAAAHQMAGRPPYDGPVDLMMLAVFGVPSSWSKKRQAMALRGEIRPAKKPDLDNITKACVDACNSVVYKDDVQIVSSYCIKMYGPNPRVELVVKATVSI